MTSTKSPLVGANLSILVGTLSRDPDIRVLPSGDSILTLEVTVRREGASAESVPVSWGAPTAAASAWRAGEEVVVVGRVRRRFFRAGGATQSRTEVVATAVVPARRAAAARRAVRRAVDDLAASLLE